MNYYTRNSACRDACNECKDACSRCKILCLNGDANNMLDCIKICDECALWCSMCATLAANDAQSFQLCCDICAKVCTHCKKICEKYPEMGDVMEGCIKACNVCIVECEKMIKTSTFTKDQLEPFHQRFEKYTKYKKKYLIAMGGGKRIKCINQIGAK